MIVLNINKKLIKVDSWDDIEGRPGFTKNLDPKTHKLKEIIGRYVFGDRIACGLSDCHTPHIRGYIVVTNDGLETNIGKDCGKTYFGVNFEDLSRKFDRYVTEQENRERLWSFSFRLDELKQRIDDLQNQENGARWVYNFTRPLLEVGKGLPSEILQHISRMIRARQSTLYIQRVATEEEIEQLEVAEGREIPRPYYIDEPVAQIAGFEALYPENDLRKLLVVDLLERIKRFETKNIDTLRYDELREEVVWIDTIESNLERANAAVLSGRALLTKANLQSFTQCVRGNVDISEFRKYLKSFPAR